MRFTRLLAWRYTFGLQKKIAVTLISRFAAFVVGVAVFAFFIVLSVFGGLRQFGLEFTHAFDPDIYIESTSAELFRTNDSVLQAVRQHQKVEVVSATLSQEMMVRFEDRAAFANVIGVDSLFNTVVSGETMVGEWIAPNTHELVLGIGVLSQLDGAAYDHPEGVILLVPNQKNKSILNQQPFRAMNATVRGVFQLGETVDETTAFAPLAMVRELLRISPENASALCVKLTPEADDQKVQETLQGALGSNFRVLTKSGRNPALYKMLQTERVAVIGILSLVVLIALFNVVGAIIMTVLEKKENIKTLYQLGAPVTRLQQVFFRQGVLLSGVGGGIGLLVALVLVVLQKTTAFVQIPGSYLAYPVALEWSAFWTVFLVVGGLSTLVSWLTAKVVKGVVRQ
jgi:lipoprotein-releasing system permease protein